jgi:dolichol-phosphate mannosyltransferase
MATARTLLFIPTYNERENVPDIYGQIKALGLDLDLLFVDDNSPDGTGEILDAIAKNDGRVHVMHRAGKMGIGTAHLEAIQWAYDQGYAIAISMDCDLTHSPTDIGRFIDQAEDFQIVVGSRFLAEGSLADWNLYRKFLTHLGHLLTRYLLHVPYDATGGFRLYRLDRIDRDVFRRIQSNSYSFFFESMYLLCREGATVREVPIALPRRNFGNSKMSMNDIVGSLRMLAAIYARSLAGGKRKLGS